MPEVLKNNILNNFLYDLIKTTRYERSVFNYCQYFSFGYPF